MVRFTLKPFQPWNPVLMQACVSPATRMADVLRGVGADIFLLSVETELRSLCQQTELDLFIVYLTAQSLTQDNTAWNDLMLGE